MNRDSPASNHGDHLGDIAIIGMSCRFPGGVNNPSEFWDFLMAGGDGIVPVPSDRWENQAYFDADKDKKNRMYVNRGGFIRDIDQFDPLFFGIAPAEASRMDPQHRWLLELTYEALENAGIKARELRGSDTAVFIGQFMHDYEQLQVDSQAHGLINSHSATGPSMTLTANRISYVFDFKGPSVTLDTACSSSLVALDMACKAILAGDSGVAIAGGVNILLRPELTMSICKASMLSPEGQCKSFDAAANGYVRSEGAGVVLVKRLSDARRDGNNILAVIKSSGVNQDGQTAGITVPNGEAQKALLLKSLNRAGLPAAEIQYVEAHGTGTAVGDPIEVNALGAVLGPRTKGDAPCVIGSVKSNLGHTEAAAGIAGLIKTVMAMNRGVIPKNIHYHNTNPAIDLRKLNLRVANEHLAWPDTTGKSRKALVNSFGFGGTNANVVLEQAPAANTPSYDQAPVVNPGVKLLPISSKTEQGLKDQAARFLKYLAERNSFDGNGQRVELHDVCFTAATRREHHKFRLVVTGFDGAGLQRGLEEFVSGQPSSAYVSKVAAGEDRAGICFVFSGMGTQWAGMGRELYQTEPVFRTALDRCSAALEHYTGWSVVAEIYQASNREKIDDTCIAQPAIFSVQVALAALLKSWGVEPGAVVGHSLGEVSAAYIAGALSFDDAIRVIYHRSRLQHTTEGMGKMLAVGLSEAALPPYLAGFETKVSVAAINSEEAITLSGDEAALTAIAARLDEEGRFARFLKVGVPYHSPVMEQLKVPLLDSLRHIAVRDPHTRLYSTVTGCITQPGDWNAQYWAANVREPVLFKAAIKAVAEDGFRIFLEVAPHAALSSSIDKNLAHEKSGGAVVATLQRGQNGVAMLAHTLAGLHASGWPLDWSRLYPNGGRFVTLPNYAWQHASYWCEAEEVQRSRLRNVRHRSGFSEPVHPLLGSKLQSLASIWQKTVDLQEPRYLVDHQVEAEVVYPAAAYIELALAIARQREGQESITLEEIEFKRPLFLDREKPALMESALNPDGNTISISAVDAQTGQWNVYSQATVADMVRAAPSRHIALSDLQGACPSVLAKVEFYKHCHKLGLSYQKEFQPVETAWFGETDVVVQLALPDSLTPSSGDYLLHPVMLDGAFQGIFAAVTKGYLPVKIAALHYYKSPSRESYCHVRVKLHTDTEIMGDLTLFDPDGTTSVEICGVELKSIKTQELAGSAAHSILYEFGWQKKDEGERENGTPARPGAPWILFSDAKGVGRRLARELERRSQSVVFVERGELPDVANESGFSTCVRSNEDLVPLFRRFAAPCGGIIYLWGLDAAPSAGLSDEEMLTSCEATTVIPMHIAQALEKVEWRNPLHVYFASRLVHALEDADGVPQPSQGALWGLGRVFSAENPAYKFTLVDLGERLDDDLIAAFANQILQGEYEQEIALRPSARYVNRLRPLTESHLCEHAHRKQIPAGDRPFRITRKAGAVETEELTATAFALPELEANDVALKVDCAAIGLHDLAVLLESPSANAPAEAAGGERGYPYVGVVTQAGAGVRGFSIGDQVVAFARHGLSSVAQASAGLSVRKPANLAAHEAVVLPAAFVPAHYALNHLARIAEGESVLIHEAADTVGLAAVQLAGLRRARVFATARTPEQRARLRALGAVHVHDSSSHEFVDQIMAETGGRGIDVGLNLLTGPFVSKTVALLKPFARIVELGPRSPRFHPALSEKLFEKNISHHSVNLQQLVAQRADLCGGLLREVAALFDAGALSPIPVSLFSSASVANAISHLRISAGRETAGVTFHDSQLRVAPGIEPRIVHRHRTYLVTGGLGGLGLEIMNWLAEAGAQSIVLIGRGAPNENALGIIKSARDRGVIVTTLKADVASADDVARVLRVIEEQLPPLAGIVHAAGVLDDGVIMQQTAERFLRVLAPKVRGAWNLHQLTEHLALDFFVCFSSIASVVGWAGQSNYAAANAFMDTLAHHRHARGKPALSINWGPWSGSGMAANLDARDIQRMSDAGMTALAPRTALAAMARLMAHHVPQAGVFDLDWSLLFKQEADPSRKTLFRDLIGANASSARVNFLDKLKCSSPALHEDMLAEEISSQLAAVLGIESAASIDRGLSVFDYGINSLMAMDLRNRLQGVLQTKLPATLVMKYPTVNAMVRCILDQVLAGAAEADGDRLYWDPKNPDVVFKHEINGPLTTFSTSVLNWMHEGHTTHFNVGTLLEIGAAKFDLAALKTTLRILLTHHDGCRVQIFPDGVAMRQEIVPLTDGVAVAEHDFTGLGYAEGAARMRALSNALHQSFTFTRGDPLYRAAYYRIDDENPHRFLLVFHHYISDGWSQKLLAEDFKSAYLKVLGGEAVRLPAKGYSLKDWSEKLHDFAHGAAVAQLPYWLGKIEKSRTCFIPDEIRSNRERRLDDHVIHTAVLAPEDYGQLSAFCRTHNFEVPDVGAYALVKAFSRLTRAESLWVEVITHARAGIFDDVEIPDLFGQISESASILFELVPQGTHAGQIRAMREQRLAVPNGGIGLRALRFINQHAEVCAQLTNDAAPQVGLNFDLTDYEIQAEKSWFGFAREGIGEAQGQHLRKTGDKLRLAFFVDGRIRGGALALSFAYYKDRFHPQTIAALADDFVSVLKAVASEGAAPCPEPARVTTEPAEGHGALLAGISEGDRLLADARQPAFP